MEPKPAAPFILAMAPPMLTPAETRPELEVDPPRFGFNGDIPPIRPLGPSTLSRPEEVVFFFMVADLGPPKPLLPFGR